MSPRSSAPHDPEHPWTLEQALRTRALWLIITAITLSILATGGVAFHQVSYFTDIGIAATVAALSVSLYAFSGAIGNAGWGFLAERISERYLAVMATDPSTVAIFALLFVRSPAAALICAVAFGVASRGETAIVNIILAQYFGRYAYGAISGFVLPFQQAGLGLGPLVASLFFDLTGSYAVGFTIFAVANLVAAMLFWWARRPRP